MKRIIERFYSAIFENNEETNEGVPYGNKAFMFYFTLVVVTIVMILIVSQLVKNFQAITVPPAQ